MKNQALLALLVLGAMYLVSCASSSESASSAETFYQNLSKDEFGEAVKSFDHVLFQTKSQEEWLKALNERQKALGSLKSFDLQNPLVAEQENLPMLTLRYMADYEHTTLRESVTLVRGKGGYLISGYTYSDLYGSLLYDALRKNSLDTAIMAFDSTTYAGAKKEELRNKLRIKLNVMGVPNGFDVVSAQKDGNKRLLVFEVLYPKGKVRESVEFVEKDNKEFKIVAYNYDINKEEQVYKAKLDSAIKLQGKINFQSSLLNGRKKGVQLNASMAKPIPNDMIVVKKRGQ